MFRKLWLGVALVAAMVSPAASQVFDYSKYPDLKGQWDRFVVPGLPGQPSFDQTRPWGNGQQAPLTPEYQAILDASIADQEKGGLGNSSEHVMCRGAGMPFMMIAFRPLEFVITPGTTYVLIADYDALRRIFTDGRDWPAEFEPTIQGYSIGKWVDEDGDGKFDVLEVRRAASRDTGSTTSAASRCTAITSRCSRSAFSWTRTTPTFSTTSSR
jgi:hypothetical protein